MQYGPAIDEALWTIDAIDFVNRLKAADSPLAIWAEVRIDDGDTVVGVAADLKAALALAE